MRNLKKLFEILDRWKFYYIFSGVFLIISISIRMLEPRVLQIAIDGVIQFFANGGTGKLKEDFFTRAFYALLPEMRIDNLNLILISLGLLFLGLSLLRALFMFVSSSISASSTEKAIKKLRDKLFYHLQLLPMSFHSKTPTGEMIQRCTGDVETVRKFVSMQVVETLRMSALFLAAFVMMWTIDWVYALIAISVLPIIVTGSIYFFKRESDVWTEHEKRQDKLTAMVQENLSGIRIVKAFAKEAYEIDKFTKQNADKKKWGLKLVKLHSFFWPSSEFFVYLQIAVSIFAGGYFTLKGRISVGEYVAFYSYAALITWPMRRLAQLVSEMGMATVAIDRIYSILNSKEEDYSGEDSNGESLEGIVEFDNVYFRYNKEQPDYVLNGVTFRINGGEEIALLGPTGSGKSTIISLLMRFYEPESGCIRIDGVDIRSYSKSYLRNRIGVVLQKSFLFSTTIKNNIAYSNTDIHIEEIVESAKVAKIHEIIEEAFPDSYETVVGEKGVTLSGGQRQRVAIARTLLKEPDILVLDDSTSSVDTETEFQIQNALDGVLKDKTTIIIAHRITSVQRCSKIIVLEKGKVTEFGTHNELINQNGFYKKMYEIQSLIDEEIRNDEASYESEKREESIRDRDNQKVRA